MNNDFNGFTTKMLHRINAPIMVNSIWDNENGEYRPSDVIEMKLEQVNGREVLLITPECVALPGKIRRPQVKSQPKKCRFLVSYYWRTGYTSGFGNRIVEETEEKMYTEKRIRSFEEEIKKESDPQNNMKFRCSIQNIIPLRD